MIVLGMVGAGFQSKDSSVWLRRTLGPRMEKHLTGLSGPASRFPIDVVDMPSLVRQMLKLATLGESQFVCRSSNVSGNHCVERPLRPSPV